jgi:VanZ family protein
VTGGSRRRVSKVTTGPVLEQPLQRRRWLRALAYLWGALVMMAHVYNFKNPQIVNTLFPKDIRDVVYHSSMFVVFTLLFRFSLADVREYSARVLRPADITALLVCCGWGGLCEVMQIRIPGREFHYNELALNMTVPLIVVALVSLALRRD